MRKARCGRCRRRRCLACREKPAHTGPGSNSGSDPAAKCRLHLHIRRRARRGVLRIKLTDAGAPKVSPSVQTAAITLIRSGVGLKANSKSAREVPAPGSMGCKPSKSMSQTFFAFLAGCEEEEISKTRAHTGLPLRFVTVQVGRPWPAGLISTRNSGRSVSRCG